MKFHFDPHCTRCDLSDGGFHSVCVPTRYWRPPSSDSRPQALVVVGKAPGGAEDKECKCFVGPSGQILDGWLQALDLPGNCDVILTNTVRCRLSGGDDRPLTQKQIWACRRHLAHDLRTLQRHNYIRITLLLLGASASQAFGRKAIRTAIRSQGSTVPVYEQVACKVKHKINRKVTWVNKQGEAHTVRVHGFRNLTSTIEIGRFPLFVTYHPAACLPDRSPQLIHAVADHLDMLSDHLAGREKPNISIPSEVSAAIPPDTVKEIALDIETYGILQDHKQTVFHPQKSYEKDRPTDRELIVCAGIAWVQPSVGPFPSELLTGSFIWDRGGHFWMLRDCIKTLQQNGGTLIFMNALFDLSYLRRFSAFRDVLCPPLQVEDLVLWNQLSNDQRAERDLKSLQRLYRLKAGPAHKFVQYAMDDDPELHHYVKEDAATTLYLRNKMLRSVDPQSTAPYARKWFSNLIWSTLHLVESGVKFDRYQLQDLSRRMEKEIDNLDKKFRSLTHDSPISGKGSVASIKKVVTEAWLSLGKSPALTDKGNIKTDAHTLQELLLDLDDVGHESP